MVDNNKDNDDYQFVDIDAVNADSTEDLQNLDSNSKSVFAKKINAFPLDTKRKALIVLLVLTFSIFIYKWMSSSSSSKKKSVASTGVSIVQPSLKPVAMQPSLPVATTNTGNIDEKIERKLFHLEQNQEAIRSDFLVTTNQINGITTNMASMAAKIEELNQVIIQLVEKIKAQEIQQVKARVIMEKRPRSRAVASHHSSASSVRYFIQAVIPGRAWLIATNGSTLTVREGTMISGYGMVTLIDPRQGRVLTSSGQVIRFSPEDS
jgi:intracellular multiplication protein IcmG